MDCLEGERTLCTAFAFEQNLAVDGSASVAPRTARNKFRNKVRPGPKLQLLEPSSDRTGFEFVPTSFETVPLITSSSTIMISPIAVRLSTT